MGKVMEMEVLPDPKGDRQFKEVAPPVHKPLAASVLFGAGKRCAVTG